MTHASGIKVSAQLNDDFKTGREKNFRCMQIRIEDESLILNGSDNANGTFADDYDRCIKKYLKNNECCYILYRTDNQNSLGYDWLFLHWVPDAAPIREKMIYASTRVTLKREFGESYFTEDITGHDELDLLYSGYQKHMASKTAPLPYSQAELELMDIKMAEKQTALDDGHRTLKCVGFPPTDALVKELEKFCAEETDFIEMSIEIDKEQIKSEYSLGNITCEEVPSKINPDKPRYYLFRFRHKFEDDDYKSIIFIYNMPGYTATVKERMLYSSCKAPFIETIESHFKLDIKKKLELIGGDFSDLAVDHLLLEIHPPKVDSRPRFSKPVGPTNRGPKRLIKD